MLVSVFLTFSTLFLSKESLTQPNFYGVWLDYNDSNNLKGNWFMESDFGYRFRLDYTDNWQRLHGRSGVGYKFKNSKVISGLALFLVYLPQRVADLEIRPWQGVKYSWPKSNRVELKHFVRFEERIHFLGTSTNKTYNYFELKFRYGLMFQYILNKTENKHGEWVGLFGFEPFFNLYVNQEPIRVVKSRTSLGFKYSFSTKTKVRVLYIYEPDVIPILQEQNIYSNNFRVSVIQKF